MKNNNTLVRIATKASIFPAKSLGKTSLMSYLNMRVSHNRVMQVRMSPESRSASKFEGQNCLMDKWVTGTAPVMGLGQPGVKRTIGTKQTNRLYETYEGTVEKRLPSNMLQS